MASGELKSAADAMRLAAKWAGVSASAVRGAYRVRRLDRHGEAYYLVQAGDFLVCFDEATGERLVSAETSKAPIAFEAKRAVERAKGRTGARAELVWAPCGATLSMFDPLWEVRENDRVVYIDQRGRPWDRLPPKRPGGGPG